MFAVAAAALGRLIGWPSDPPLLAAAALAAASTTGTASEGESAPHPLSGWQRPADPPGQWHCPPQPASPAREAIVPVTPLAKRQRPAPAQQQRQQEQQEQRQQEQRQQEQQRRQEQQRLQQLQRQPQPPQPSQRGLPRESLAAGDVDGDTADACVPPARLPAFAKTRARIIESQSAGHAARGVARGPPSRRPAAVQQGTSWGTQDHVQDRAPTADGSCRRVQGSTGASTGSSNLLMVGAAIPRQRRVSRTRPSEATSSQQAAPAGPYLGEQHCDGTAVDLSRTLSIGDPLPAKGEVKDPSAATFADALSPSLLIHQLKSEGGCRRMTVSPTANPLFVGSKLLLSNVFALLPNCAHAHCAHVLSTIEGAHLLKGSTVPAAGYTGPGVLQHAVAAGGVGAGGRRPCLHKRSGRRGLPCIACKGRRGGGGGGESWSAPAR